MKQHIEKTEQLINRINAFISQAPKQTNYIDKQHKLKQEISQIQEWAEKNKKFCDESYASEKSEVFRKLIQTCEVIENYIQVTDSTTLSLENLKNEIQALHSTQTTYINQVNFSDITTKILMLEDNYQSGEMTAEAIAKHIEKLEHLPILNENSVEAQNAKNLIASYKKEFNIETDINKEYFQKVQIPSSLEKAFEDTESNIETILNMLPENNIQTEYRPEFESLCEMVSRYITQFPNISIKDWETELNKLIINLQAQTQTAYNEQITQAQHNDELENLNSRIQAQASICQQLNNATTLTLYDQQFDTLFSQIEKMDNLQPNMPINIYENLIKSIGTTLATNTANTANTLSSLGQQPENLMQKGRKAYQLFMEVNAKAEQLGIQL